MKTRCILLLFSLNLFGSFGFSQGELIPFQYNGKFGYKNMDDEIVVSPKYDFAGEFHEDAAIVSKENKIGFLDSSGKEITPLKYDKVWPFDNGRAVVYMKGKGKGKGLVDYSGKEITPLKYHDILNFENGRAIVQIDYNYGLIDYSGKEVVPVSDGYWIIDRIRSTYVAEKSEKYGLIDQNGNPLTEFKYDRIWASENVFLFEIDGKEGLINTKGQVITSKLYDDIDEFSEGVAAVINGNGVGYIDESANEIIPTKYNSAFNFSDGLGLVRYKENFIYVDKNAKEVLKVDYKIALPFKEGLAPVIDHNNKVGYINKKGELVIPCKYDNYYDNISTNDFNRESIAGVNHFSEGLVAVRKEMVKNGEMIAKYGFIDKKGNTVIPFIYDDAESFNNNLAEVSIKGLSGYIDRAGKEVIPIEYPPRIYVDSKYKLGSFSEGLINIRRGDKWGYLNIYGKTIIPFIFDEASSFKDGEAEVTKDGFTYYIYRQNYLKTRQELERDQLIEFANNYKPNAETSYSNSLAEEKIKKALKFDPTNASYINKLEEIKYFNKRKVFDSHIHKGNMYEIENSYKLAIQEYEKALAIFPDDEGAKNKIEEARQSMEDKKESKAEMIANIQAEIDAGDKTDEQFLRQVRFKIQDYIKDYPNDTEFLIAATTLYIKERLDLEEAYKMAQMAYKADPNNLQNLKNIGDIHYYNNNLKEAVESLKLAIDLPQPLQNDVIEKLTQAYYTLSLRTKNKEYETLAIKYARMGQANDINHPVFQRVINRFCPENINCNN